MSHYLQKRVNYEIDEIKEAIEALNDILDDNEEVYSNEFKEKSILNLTLLRSFFSILNGTIK